MPGEESLVYDIRFTVRLPEGGSRHGCRILINAEPMDRFPSLYLWMNRAQVCTARSVSDQPGHIRQMHYDDIAPVYSVWIIMASPQKHANTVTLLSGLQKFELNGHYEGKTGMNMMNIILICLPKDGEEGKAEGIMEARVENTLNMIRDGSLTTEQIVKFSGISREEVKKLKKQA